MLIDLRFDLYISPQDFRTYTKRATEGEPQPIAISSSFQRAMNQMQLAQQRLESNNNNNGKPNNNNDAGNSSGSPKIPNSTSVGQDLSNQGGGDGLTEDERRLPPNRNALNPDGQAAPSLQL